MLKETEAVRNAPKAEGKLLQWHPAFYAGTQIELKESAEVLIFENEHQLSTKPMEIDVLIIKKDGNQQIQKNIGRIFRRYNILEYKSPTDYLSIDDFYKVYGYACFYKADTGQTDSISIEALTISFVCMTYPVKLIKHLQCVRNYMIEMADDGIYYVYGDKIPIQIIVTKQLSPDKNLWLSSLTNQLDSAERVQTLAEDYRRNKSNSLYRSVMNVITRANMEQFQEVKTMCEALMELFKDEIEASESKGKIEGKIEGEQRVNSLTIRLSEAGRVDDIIKAASDPEYQKKLFEEFGI